MISQQQLTTIRVTLVCGIAASLWYVLLNVIIPLYWPAYDSVTQTVSELSAIGAPTRSLWIWLSLPYTIMSILFAWGVCMSSENNRPLRVTY